MHGSTLAAAEQKLCSYFGWFSLEFSRSWEVGFTNGCVEDLV